jgi:hypothetical protein
MKNLNISEIQSISGGERVLIGEVDYRVAHGIIGGVAPCVMVPVYRDELGFYHLEGN